MDVTLSEEIRYKDDLIVTLGVAGMYGYSFYAESILIEEVPDNSSSYLVIKPRGDYAKLRPSLVEVEYLRHLRVTIASRISSSLELTAVVVNDPASLDISADGTLVLDVV